MVNYLCIFEDITMSNTMIPLIYLYMIGLLLFLCSKFCVCSFQFNKNFFYTTKRSSLSLDEFDECEFDFYTGTQFCYGSLVCKRGYS